MLPKGDKKFRILFKNNKLMIIEIKESEIINIKQKWNIQKEINIFKEVMYNFLN